MTSDQVALTATVADLGPDLEDWCAYHLRHFGRIILWLDHHAHLDHPDLPRHPAILALPGDQTASSSRHTNFMHRQNANADAALKLCLEARAFFARHILPESELARLEAEGIIMRADPLGEAWRPLDTGLSAERTEPADTL